MLFLSNNADMRTYHVVSPMWRTRYLLFHGQTWFWMLAAPATTVKFACESPSTPFCLFAKNRTHACLQFEVGWPPCDNWFTKKTCKKIVVKTQPAQICTTGLVQFWQVARKHPITANPFYGLQCRVTMQNLAAHPGLGIFCTGCFIHIFQKNRINAICACVHVLSVKPTIQWYVWVQPFSGMFG